MECKTGRDIQHAICFEKTSILDALQSVPHIEAMSNSDSAKSQKQIAKEQAEARRAQALRDNLRRRKAAAKAAKTKATEKPEN